MDLYVVRHAEAGARDAQRWPDDADRPLTTEGAEQFRRAARGLRSLVTRVDLVLSSPAARAWQTAIILTEEAGWPAPQPLDRLGLSSTSSARYLLEALGPYAADEAVAVVGHDPRVSEIVSYLITGNEGTPRVTIAKGAVARVSIGSDPREGSSVLRWLAVPRMFADGPPG